MRELDREIIEFDKWRVNINETLPDLVSRVFALRHKTYIGCGFHWSLEKLLGQVIIFMNDYDSEYRLEEDRLVVKVTYERFIDRLKLAETDVARRAELDLKTLKRVSDVLDTYIEDYRAEAEKTKAGGHMHLALHFEAAADALQNFKGAVITIMADVK